MRRNTSNNEQELSELTHKTSVLMKSTQTQTTPKSEEGSFSNCSSALIMSSRCDGYSDCSNETCERFWDQKQRSQETLTDTTIHTPNEETIHTLSDNLGSTVNDYTRYHNFNGLLFLTQVALAASDVEIDDLEATKSAESKSPKNTNKQAAPDHERKLKLNAEAAKRFREKKANIMHQLEQTVAKLQGDNGVLQKEVSQIEHENQIWKAKEREMLYMRDELEKRISILRSNAMNIG